MSFNFTFKCYKCKQSKLIANGFKFISVGRYKRRICANCSNLTESVTNDKVLPRMSEMQS